MTDILRLEAAAPAAHAQRSAATAIRRGFACRCPNCGEGKLYRKYLKVVDACAVCGEDMSHQRADDAPAYITMFVVGHFIVAGIVAAEEWWPNSPIFLPALGWSAMAALSSLWLLPRIKGALIGYQWAMRMHGFGGPERDYI